MGGMKTNVCALMTFFASKSPILIHFERYVGILEWRKGQSSKFSALQSAERLLVELRVQLRSFCSNGNDGQ